MPSLADTWSAYWRALSKEMAAEPLKVQTREGLSVGLAVAVRYRIDDHRLAFIHANLPQPVDKELVPPVVASAYTV